jgi:hypothetical protein
VLDLTPEVASARIDAPWLRDMLASATLVDHTLLVPELTDVTNNLCATTMKKSVFRTLSVLASLGGLAAPIPSRAHAIDPQLDCKSSAHGFIASLLDDQSIDSKPMRIEANSVNAFLPVHGGNLTAFGFHVYAVFGYEQGDPMFKQGSGEPMTASTNGVVVTGAAESVEHSHDRPAATPASGKLCPLLLTAVFCNGH